MRIIVDDYMNPVSNTQSGYLYHALKDLKEHEVLMYNKKQPLFEVLDRFNPDIYITACSQASIDLPVWIKESGKDLKLFVNISNEKQGYIYEIESHFRRMGIDFTFFGDLSGVQKILTKKSKIVSLLNAVDENIIAEKKYFKEKIDCLYFMDDKDAIEEFKSETYHICSSKYVADIRFDLLTAVNSMFHNYKEVVFCNLEAGLSQAFFESLYRADKTYFISHEHTDKINETISKVMGGEYNLDYNSKDKLKDFSTIKETIKNKHTGTNRVKQLLSQCSGVKC